ncbi:MAG TPA: hypothetical protein PLS20_10940 [Ruminococcus flavefaciens]|nr:hypothetical protein [Ruminococcus flavefaciens]
MANSLNLVYDINHRLSGAEKLRRKETIMKEYTFVIFKQIRKECAMNDDPVVGYVHGIHADAQSACNELNAYSPDYHYYMDLDELKAHGFQI